MDGEVPGAPNEVEKPKSTSDKISFSLKDLTLVMVDTFNLERHLHFLVRNEFHLIMKEFEYYSYLNVLFTEIEILKNEQRECICDKVETDSYDYLGDIKVSFQKLNEVTNKLETEEVSVPSYLTYSFIADLEIGFHQSHK